MYSKNRSKLKKEQTIISEEQHESNSDSAENAGNTKNDNVKSTKTGNSAKTDKDNLSKSLEGNITLLKNIFSNDETLIVRRFQNKYLDEAKCGLLYFDGMVNSDILNKNIIQPILTNNLTEGISAGNLLEELQNKVIVSNEVRLLSDIDVIISLVAYGDTVFFVEGYESALVISTKGWKTRAISEPESEKVVRGPKEMFTESIQTNLSLLRRKIKSSELKLEFREMGERTHTTICICYIDGLALDDVLKELRKRLDNIKIDAILDSGYIQELIRDEPFSPFETVGYSEKPDVIAARLLEGRIAIFADGSPYILTVPFILAENTQTSEDYYNNYIFASFNRFVRTASSILAASVPALYLALVTYHQELLPTSLLLSISAARQGVPFPTAISLLIMLLIFDILREAGTRMPVPIGQTINIVGTLVLGQAAVEARLVCAPVIIITALSGILTLMNVTLIGGTLTMRFALLAGTAILGVYGFIFVFILIFLHLMTMRSFGVPYFLNITSFRNHNYQDVWIRAPWWSMTLRPKIIAARNLVRQSGGNTRKKRPS